MSVPQAQNLLPPYHIADEPAIEWYLLGLVDFASAHALQQRLVYECDERGDGRMTMLVCEHPPCVSVGRAGSYVHVRMALRDLTARSIALHWVNRGGGCLVHGPGQLALYAIVPLAWHGWSIGGYLQRLQSGLQTVLSEFKVSASTRPARYGLWGRTGQLVTIAAAVRHGIAWYGAYLNVSTPLYLLRSVQSDPFTGTPPGNLLAERGRPLRMSSVREAVVRNLTEALGGRRYHVYADHPLLVRRRVNRA